MKKRIDTSMTAMPMLLTRLGLASWETIARRGMMMANGTCSASEFRRMTTEKMAAARHSFAALATGGSAEAVLAPYLDRARANARRLRRAG